MVNLRDFIPLGVFIPSFILLHYGWYKLQFNNEFVPESERNLQIWSFYKNFFKKTSVTENSETTTADNKKQ